MLPWIVFSIILCIVGAVLTIIWWRVGDIWADEEHKRFKTADSEGETRGATVVKRFDESPSADQDQPPEV